VPLDCRDPHGMSPPAHAAKEGWATVVEFLLSSNQVEVNGRDLFGRTPLLLAAKKKKLNVVKYLMTEGGADAEATNALGRNILCRATQLAERPEDIIDLVSTVVPTGKCDLRVVDNEGNSAL
ncbi:ankyrin repeat-containing domain protein, partial [Cercophora samala]